MRNEVVDGEVMACNAVLGDDGRRIDNDDNDDGIT